MHRRDFLKSIGVLAGSLALPIPLPVSYFGVDYARIKPKPITKADVQKLYDRMLKLPPPPRYVYWQAHPNIEPGFYSIPIRKVEDGT